MMEIYYNGKYDKEELWYIAFAPAIFSLFQSGELFRARQLAFKWAEGVSASLGIRFVESWKLFKRSVAYVWFGKPENRRFLAPWNTTDVMVYCELFPEGNLRYSLFPKEIACHAQSLNLPAENREIWHSLIDSIDHNVDLEIFPETPKDVIAFRNMRTCFSEIVEYEAGFGQAMHIFEQERGHHAIVRASFIKDVFVYTDNIGKNSEKENLLQIRNNLDQLISMYEPIFKLKCFGMCKLLGVDSISIEGYFDPSKKTFIIVDLDLPFDFVFMNKSAK